MLTIRIDAAIKAQIETAARNRGQSLSAFVLEAAKSAAAKAKPLPLTKGRSGSAPAFIAAACRTAQNGGPRGYWAVGYELARHAATLGSDKVPAATWQKRIDAFTDLLHEGEVAAVVSWMRENLVECMAHIPPRRHEQAALGAIACYEDGKVE